MAVSHFKVAPFGQRVASCRRRAQPNRKEPRKATPRIRYGCSAESLHVFGGAHSSTVLLSPVVAGSRYNLGMNETIGFSIEGPAPNENPLGTENRNVRLTFSSDESTSNGFDTLCEKVSATLEGQGLKTGSKDGATNVAAYVTVDVDDKGAPGSEGRTVVFGFRTDHSVHETRDLIVKAMEDADVKLRN